VGMRISQRARENSQLLWQGKGFIFAFNVRLEFLKRGYSEEEIRKLWGGNLLSVWR